MKWRENTALKALAFLLAVAAYTAAALMGWYQLANFDVLWDNSGTYGPGDSYTVRYLERQAVNDLECLLDIYSKQARGEALNVYTAQEKTWLEDAYSAEKTNLRWQALDGEGKVRFGNTREEIPDRAQGLNWTTYEWCTRKLDIRIVWGAWQDYAGQAVNVDTDNVSSVHSASWREELRRACEEAGTADETAGETSNETVYLDQNGEGDLLIVITDEGTYLYAPSVHNFETPNECGYRYLLSGDAGWTKVTEPQAASETFQLVMWPDMGLEVDDRFAEAIRTIMDWQYTRESRLAVTLLCGVLGVLLTIYLCAGAGHKKGREGITLNWFHRLPGDLTAAVMVSAVIVLAYLALEGIFGGGFYGRAPMWEQMLILGAIAAAGAALCLGLLVTFAARCKAGTLVRNTLLFLLCRRLWRLCVRLWRLCGRCWRAGLGAVRAVPLYWKVVVFGMGYGLFTVLTMFRWTGLWLLWSALALAAACLWAYQWKLVRRGTREIIGGNPEYHIDTTHMFPDLRSHAGELNSLGRAVSAAVDERMRSERFKAELITNVSHDLKTPLTSIINYVDLLKKENIDNPRAAEYIEVLDRKSRRLKKLTEDLVEASKASTGSLTVSLERLGLSELAGQALAEYAQRLEAQSLAVVQVFPADEVWVYADGRHLWRVLDNLLGNCAKYALAGTRVYVEVRSQGGYGVLSVKNISRDALNVPPEALLERFVRGDESRATEGSGLGLSIAQSLTELQHGRFQLDIDGDLFKAAVSLPECAPAEPESIGLPQ